MACFIDLCCPAFLTPKFYSVIHTLLSQLFDYHLPYMSFVTPDEGMADLACSYDLHSRNCHAGHDLKDIKGHCPSLCLPPCSQ